MSLYQVFGAPLQDSVSRRGPWQRALGYPIPATPTNSSVDPANFLLRSRARFLLSQAGQRLFVAAVFGVGAALVYPPRDGGWIFFGPFAALAVLASIYALAVAVM